MGTLTDDGYDRSWESEALDKLLERKKLIPQVKEYFKSKSNEAHENTRAFSESYFNGIVVGLSIALRALEGKTFEGLKSAEEILIEEELTS